MARFQTCVDIWDLSEDERSRLQVGQWVTAGPGGQKGRFYGHGQTTVVAWLSNARAYRDFRGYLRTIRDYGRTVTRRAAA